MTPLAAAGLLLNASARDRIVGGGQELADRISAVAFQPAHLAPVFADRDVTPFERYPLNSYLVDDPDVQLVSSTLLTLIVLPALYRIFEGARGGRGRDLATASEPA